MAKKGQKFDKYNSDFVEKVLEYRKNNSVTQTAKYFNIPVGTVNTWVHKEKYNLTGRKRGRPLDNETSYKKRYEILKKFDDFLREQKKKK